MASENEIGVREVRLRRLAHLRVLVGYLGERGQHGWWPREFYSAISEAFLAPVFARTTVLAQNHGVSEAARRVHDEHIGIGRVSHLFRLPQIVEQAVFECLKTPAAAEEAHRGLKSMDGAMEALQSFFDSPLYPSLTSQTLYTAVNDFVEPKLKSVSHAAQDLRAKTGRSGAEERELERLQDFERELTDLRDTLLAIAREYRPNHDDGVQITAASLWPLFRHKPWQKVLKQTWQKLEKGDYDWAHLAYNYWPERVREKYRTDKSLAIAHGLEEPPENANQGRRGRRKGG